MHGGESVEGVVEKLAQRFRVLDLIKLLHALGVFHAGGLHLLDLFSLQLVDLPAENRFQVLDDRLAKREHVKGIIG